MLEVLSIFLLGVAVTLILVGLRRHYMGFTGQDPEDYAHLAPVFDLRETFDGRMRCTGTIFGPSGGVSSRFQTDVMTTWDGPEGTMTLDFTYDDGRRRNRVWLLRMQEGGRVTADATDVVGTGRGRQMGNAFGMRYTIRLAPEDGGHTLHAEDWMYLQPNGAILNRSQFRKFGITVAELFAVFERVEDDPDA